MGWEGMIFAVAFIAVAIFAAFYRGRAKFPIREPDRDAEKRAADNTLERERRKIS